MIGVLAAPLDGQATEATPGWIELALAAGMTGMFADSLLGATLEDRQRLLDNDQVNLACTLTGALAAVLLASITR